MEGRLLVTLPTSLAADILSKWLRVQDRGRLDSAHCQASVRGDFLQLVCSPESSIQSWVLDHGAVTTDRIISWANRRKCVVEKISIGEYSDVPIYTSYLQNFAKNVLFIKIHDSSLSNLSQSISKCHRLNTLDCANCEMSSTLRDVFVECKELRNFRCAFNRKCELNGDDLQGVVCPNLQYLSIPNCKDCALVGSMLKMAVNAETVFFSVYGSVNGAAYVLLDQISPRVTTLALPDMVMSWSMLDRIAHEFSNLVNLCVNGWHVSEQMVRSVAAGLPNLRALDFSASRTVSDSALTALAETCGDRVTELLLCGCEYISLTAVQQVLPLFTQLTIFSIHYEEEDYYGDGLDTGVDGIVADLSLLSRFTSLTLTYDGEGAAEFIDSLAYFCSSNLKHLHVQLTDIEFVARDMDVVLRQCSKLRTLTLAGDLVAYFTDEDVKRWQKILPGLVVSDVLTNELSVLRDLEERFA